MLRLATLLLALGAAAAADNQCAFHQTCFSNPGTDDCTPTPVGDAVLADGSWENASFPMDRAHNFSKPYIIYGENHTADAIVCPQYQDNGCCTFQSNAALASNFVTLINTFAVNQGCLACAVNLVNWWCGIVCSPDQSNFVSIPEPPNDFEYKVDNLGTGELKCLIADVYMDTDYACGLYDSCKSTGIAAQLSAMSSALGFMNYQAQTGAVHNGNEYFQLHFVDNDTVVPEGIVPFSYPLLECDEFADPGGLYPPYDYPAPPLMENNTMNCGCGACQAACSAGSTIDMTIEANPIDPLHGFESTVVFPVYGALLVIVAAVWWRRRERSKTE